MVLRQVNNRELFAALDVLFVADGDVVHVFAKLPKGRSIVEEHILPLQHWHRVDMFPVGDWQLASFKGNAVTLGGGTTPLTTDDMLTQFCGQVLRGGGTPAYALEVGGTITQVHDTSGVMGHA